MAVIDHDERLIFLSTFISVGELVRKWIDSKSTDQQPLLSLIFDSVHRTDPFTFQK